MNKLIECESCGASMSENADACPSCRQPVVPEQMANCRSCGKSLQVSKHCTQYVSSSIVNGTSTSTMHWRHTPCPSCGDPKPLFNVQLKLHLKATMKMFFMPALISGVYILMVNHGLVKLNSTPIGIVAIIAYALAWLALIAGTLIGLGFLLDILILKIKKR